MSEIPKHPDKTLGYLVIIKAIYVSVFLLFGFFANRFIGLSDSEKLTDSLLAISQVGGIISGFSLTATAILSLGGNYRKFVLTRYGQLVRCLLLENFFVVVVASLLCALSPVIDDQSYLRWILGGCLSVVILSLLVTMFLFSGAYSWNAPDSDRGNDRQKGPRRL